jgi:hypothetical protein
LLAATSSAHLADNAEDGTPRVIPVGFFWTGTEFVISTATTSPKVAALKARADVALSIEGGDTPEQARALSVRGRASVEIVDGLVPEYLAAARKSMGAEFSGGEVSFDLAEFSGGTADFSRGGGPAPSRSSATCRSFTAAGAPSRRHDPARRCGLSAQACRSRRAAVGAGALATRRGQVGAPRAPGARLMHLHSTA